MLDFIPLLTMSSGQPPGIQTLNDFPGLRALHLRHALLLSTVGNVPMSFMVCSDHRTPCFTDFLMGYSPGSGFLASPAVRVHCCSGSSSVPPDSLSFHPTASQLPGLSSTFTSTSRWVPPTSPLKKLLHPDLGFCSSDRF